MSSSIMPTYNRLPVGFSRGEGVFLYDSDGTRYIDALSGIAVNSLGHGHPALVRAIQAQAEKLIHVSNLYAIEEQARLAEKLTALAGMDNVFFCNSGAEANEAAIKLARLHGHSRGLERPTIVVAEGAFHGRTLGALTATGNPNFQKGFEPLLDGFIRVPYNDVAAIDRVAKTHDDVIAVLLEPIQGEGGVRIPDEGYLRDVETLCRKHGWLFMLDEVQTGIGRTGHWFAFQRDGLTPDVVALAKGLGGGFPIGACLARGEAAGVLTASKHGSTFGGNPLACTAALAVLDTIETERLCDKAEATGNILINALRDQLDDSSVVKEIRGRGLMVAIELHEPCGELVTAGLKTERILINVTAESVIRLLPPLILNPDQAMEVAASVTKLIQTL